MTPEHPHRAREKIVVEARRWIGTPYHPCADVLGAGVDCGMLLVRVFVDLGLCAPFDPRPYAPEWHLHRDEERYLGFVFDRCRERDHPAPGDLMLFRYGRCYSHAGIVTRADPLTIVHAYAPARCVLEDQVARDGLLAAPERAPRFFSFWRDRESENGFISDRAASRRPRACRSCGSASRDPSP